MVNLHYIPVHTQPYYQNMGFKAGDFPEAEQYYREAISIPMHVNLTDADLQYVANSLREAMCI
jgi:dTDP-4-amino-4,6-dideoxygalactose transaminase